MLNDELNISQSEGISIGGHGIGVFAWAENKETSYYDQVCGCLQELQAGWKVDCHKGDIFKYLDWDGFNKRGSWVVLFPSH